MKTDVEISREEYTKLFRQYYQERIYKSQRYIREHGLGGKSIYSVQHPDFFLIDKEWDERRKILDAPLLEKAKYKVAEKIQFYYIKTSNVNGKYKEDRILSIGTITEIHTSGTGSGEIVYGFREINPPVAIINPYCLEQNVVKRI